MLNVDSKVPKDLLQIQLWFAQVLQKPVFKLDKHHLPILDKEAKKQAKIYISPSKELSSDQRVAIYNQQYWWRILKILRNDYPFLSRLFGKHSFELKIAIPYFRDFPPSYWSLYFLGENLPVWIEKNYPEKADKKLVSHAAILDRAYSQLFFETAFPAIREVDLNKKIYLQPFVKLFVLNADLFSFRSSIIKHDIDHWLDHDFPHLEKEGKYYFILFRNIKYIQYFRVEKDQYDLLKTFEKGTSLPDAIDKVANKSPYLDQWFSGYAKLNWLTYYNPKKKSL